MEYIEAPWRYDYVSRAESSGECIFCAAVGGGRATLTVVEGQHAFAMLNKYPYTSGHTMVAPKQHTADFESLPAETLGEMLRLSQAIVRALRALYRPHAFNIGFNLGESAGAGVADHLHLHIVPRWRGDTSFMTTLAATRVLPEALETTWERLSEVLRGHGA